MELHLFQTLYLVTLNIFIISINLCKFTHSYDDPFLNCTQPFNCGNVKNLKFPFWGETRAPYCGLPGFQLECHNNVPTMNMSSVEYRIIGADPQAHKLTVARADYWDSLCPSNLANTSIDQTLFKYSSLCSFITLFYGCPAPFLATPDILGHSSCDVDGEYIKVGFGAGVFAPYLGCKGTVSMPILEIPPFGVGSDFVLDSLRKGFELEWRVYDDIQCTNCMVSGGECGYNWTGKTFNCFCPDQLRASQCSTMSGDNNYNKTQSSNSEKSKNTKKTALIGVLVGGSVLVLAALLCLSLFVARRRKQLRYQAQSKDLGPGIPITSLLATSGFRSSRYTSSPSTKLSQSIHSYPSSNSDFQDSMCYFGLKVFSYTELEDATENFNESRELGDGGFGTVYYGKLHDGRLVAVKRLYENSCKHMGQFMTEIEILARLRHKNLVTLYGCTSRRSRELLLVYEYIPNGTVADHLHGKLAKSNQLTWSVRLSIAVQTADALAFLHKSDVIHRDVKTTNVLLDNNFQVKVADFGLSRLFPNDVTHVSTAPQGTAGYVDPEYYQCYQLTEKSDVYSFGVVLIELISSKPAVDITRRRHDINLSKMAVDRIKNNALHELVDPNLGYDTDYAVQKMVKSLAELAFQCLQQEKEMRPTMEQVLESLKGIQKEVLNVQKQVVLDFQESDDDAGALLKNAPPPVDTKVIDKIDR